MTDPVGVNLLWCLPGEVGGSEEYVTRTLAGMAGARGHDGLLLFTLPGFAAAHPELGELPAVAAPVSGRHRPVRVAVENTWLASQVRRHRLPLVHHAGGTVPANRVTRAVVTLHDLQYLTFPQYFSTVKLAYLRSAVPKAVRRAPVIVVPSDFVKESVVERFGQPGNLVVVVPHGLPPGFAERPATPEVALRERYCLPGPVIVYPAMTHPHKNHAMLLDAVAEVARSRPEVRLVLIGGAGRAEADVVARVGRADLAGVAVRPGRVSAADRDGLYRIASALAFPSRYEGFGAPVVEAMAFGCPVVAADATALREVVGSAGLLVDPDDTTGWADALARLADGDLDAGRLAAAGRERAARFTALASAEALGGAYRLARSL
jgi:alpha-1,3-rhamnosyl/mannosyltransferase